MEIENIELAIFMDSTCRDLLLFMASSGQRLGV